MSPTGKTKTWVSLVGGKSLEMLCRDVISFRGQPENRQNTRGSSVSQSGEAAVWTVITTERQTKVGVRSILKIHLKEFPGGLDWGGAKK